MSHYYNEYDPVAAEWLRELMRGGLIPEGDVDERDIRQVQATDFRGHARRHFFSGIGGWAEALRIAGWPADREIWSGSCPCPPFSSAGKKKHCPACGGKGVAPCPRRTGHFICLACEHAWEADGRHLWPEFWRLIAECRPAIVVGEQVAGKDAQLWYAGVRLTLEAIGYSVGATDLCAASVGETAWEIIQDGDGTEVEVPITVGPPHIRQRLFWVAVRNDGLGDADGRGQQTGRSSGGGGVGDLRTEGKGHRQATTGPGINDGPGATGGLAVSGSAQRRSHGVADGGRAGGEGPSPVGRGHADRRVADADGGQSGDRELQRGGQHGQQSEDGGDAVAQGDSIGERLEGHIGHVAGGHQPGRVEAGAARPVATAGDTGFWSACDIVRCRDTDRDGNHLWRRVPAGSLEPLLLGVAHGLPGGVGGGGVAGGGHGEGSFPLAFEKIDGRNAALKGAGNAIVPHLGAAFLSAVMEVLGVAPEWSHSG